MEKPNIRLHFQVKGIKTKGPYQIVFHKQGNNYMQTTQLLQGPNPIFIKPILSTFSFQLIQRCSICLRHKNNKDDYTMVKSKLGDIVGSPNSTKTFILNNGVQVTVTSQSITSNKDYRITKTVKQVAQSTQQVIQVAVQQNVKISLKGTKLHNTDSKFDFINKSDPYFRLLKINPDGTTIKCYQSQTIRNTLDPNWKPVELPLPSLVDRQSGKPFVVQVWDQDKKKKSDFIGQVSIYLKNIKPKQINQFHLHNSNPKVKNPGSIILTQFQITKNQLENKYLQQKQTRAQSSIKPLKIEETVNRSKSVDIPVFQKQQYKQEVQQLYQQITQQIKYDQPIVQSKKKQYIKPIKDQHLIKFMEYKKRGLQITSIVSIDFTKSNGQPQDPYSLHNKNQANPYSKALQSILSILRQYDHQQSIPLYGFGAYCSFPKFTKPDVQYLIPLTGDPQKPRVGYDQIVEVYRQSLKYVNFNGPTNVRPIIAQANKICTKEKAYRNFNKFLILLILTDGCIEDIKPTIKQLSISSDLPLSIIMIGIGDKDFSGMIQIQNADKLNQRRVMKFLQFKNYKDNGDQLASQMLRYLPTDVVQFMEMKKVFPKR